MTESETKRQQIIEKVRALMGKTQGAGASADEEQTAMNIAMKIMSMHHLTEADLAHGPEDDYAKVDASEKGQRRAFVGSVIYKWEAFLASFVREYVGCPCYIDKQLHQVRRGGKCVFDEYDEPRFGQSIVFFGVMEDAVLAADIFDELRLLIATAAAAQYGQVYKGNGGAYAEGFVSGLNTKIERARKIEQQTATNTGLILAARQKELVKYKHTAAKKWLEQEQGVRLGKASNEWSGASGSFRARTEGFNDGQSQTVNRNRTKKIV